MFNNAGHYLSISTKTFKIPSRYPPKLSLVYDMDPEFLDVTPLTDVDVHFKSSVLCASWTDFSHHEVVSYEVGVGLTNYTDDIIPFQPVNETKYVCLNSSAIQENTPYFFLLRSTCSGGSTVSSSDGVTVLDGDDIRNALVVQPGINCFGKKHDYISLQTNRTVIWKPKSLLVGQTYVITLYISEFDIHSDDAKIRKTRNSGELLMIPFRSHIQLTININSSVLVSGFADMYYCPSRDVLPNTIKLIVSWMFLKPIKGSPFVYMVGIENTNTDTLVIPYQKAAHNFQYRFKDLSSIKGKSETFVAKVKICSVTHCLDGVYSNPFTFDETDPELLVEALSAESDDRNACPSLHARWKIIPDAFRVSFHQYAITLEKDGKEQLTPWQSISTTALIIQVQYLLIPFCCMFTKGY